MIHQSLEGCIANVSVLTQAQPTEVWTPLDWTTATSYSGATDPAYGCPLIASTQNALSAVHFLGTGGLANTRACGFHFGRLNIKYEYILSVSMIVR